MYDFSWKILGFSNLTNFSLAWVTLVALFWDSIQTHTRNQGKKKSNFEESAKKKSYNLLRLYTIIYAGIHYAVGLSTEDCVGQTCDSL